MEKNGTPEKAGAPYIDLTPEVISAGVEAYQSFGERDRDCSPDEEIVEAILTAAICASTKR
jgi:hypothetical protein